MGLERPDSGSARFDAAGSRGLLPQAPTDVYATVEQALAGLDQQPLSHWEAEVERLAVELSDATPDEAPAVERAYAQALDRLSHAAAALPPHRLQQVLAGLGLEHLPLDKPVRLLSGGQKTRLGLARLLLQNPALLILDEPTNHLDIAALTWLEGYLQAYEGGMLLVSHDRAFLDRVVNGVLEIDPLTRAVRAYPGGYSDYARAKAHEREEYLQRYQEQQAKIADLEAAADRWKTHANNIQNETIHFHYRKRAKKVARQGVVRLKRVQRLLESEEHLARPRTSWSIKLDLGEAPPSGQDVLAIEGLSMAFGPLVLFEDVNLLLQRGERICAGGPQRLGQDHPAAPDHRPPAPTRGVVRLGSNVRLGYLAQEQETLAQYASPLDAIMRSSALPETDARTYLHQFLFAGDEVHTPMALLSFGQRSRLNLGLLVLQGCNLLLLDEPINHLDIPSRETFEQALAGFEGTVLAVVHDRYFIERFATGVWALRDGAIGRYPDLRQALEGASAIWAPDGDTPAEQEPPALV